MPDRLEEALVEVLARIEAGEKISTEELRADYPDCWEPIRDVFEIRGRLADVGGTGAAFAKPHVAQETKLRVVDSERYEGFRLLGEGGMGMVYWALDTELNREVAFKVVRSGAAAPSAPAGPIHVAAPAAGTPASQAFETLKARFLQEAWVTAGLEHPGIVPVYEVGQTPEGVPFYTMRFVRGSRTLTQAMSDAKTRPIDERLALLEPFLRICDTMRYAHAQGVVHRDLKPDNVVLGEFGEVVVLDWGIAKMRDRPDAAAATWRHRLDEFRKTADLRTQAGALGTPGYMSPEAATGRIDEVDERSDVYSLGAILFQLLTGRLPYEFRTYGELLHAMNDGAPPEPASLDPAVPAALSAICLRALARGRDERQQSVDSLATDVRAWLAKRARDHEIEVLEREATVAMAAMADLQGDALLKQLDRVHAAATKLLDRAPESDTARGLLREAERRRELGIRQRERVARRRILRRTLIVGLATALVAAVSVAWVINNDRTEIERARDTAGAAVVAKDEALVTARSERDAKSVALRGARVLGLAAESQVQESLQPERAVLLAREAVRLDPSSAAASNALRLALAASHERAVLRGHADVVNSAAFSPDGSRIVTASDDKTARLWDQDGREIAVLRGHGDKVRCAAFSPGGSLIVTASNDGTARLWDRDGREVAILRGHGAAVNSAAFSPDGSRVVTASDDKTARLWDSNGKVVAILAGHDAVVFSAVFSHDGSRVVTASADKTARLWDRDGKELAVLSGHQDWVRSVAIAPDGSRIVTASWDGTARLWDRDGKELAVLRGPNKRAYLAVFSPDGSRIVTAHGDSTAHVWDRDGKEIAVLRGKTSWFRSAAFSADSSLLVTASNEKTVRLWDRDGNEIAVLRGHEDIVFSAEFSADNSRIVSASRDKTARLWDRDGKDVVVLRGHEQWAFSAAFSSDGSRLVTASADATARLWNRDGTEFAVLRGHENMVNSAVFSQDGSRVVTASNDKTARLWDRDGKEVAVLRGHEAAVLSAVFSPDGSVVVTASDDKTARLWDRDGKEFHILRGHEGAVLAAAFCPDGSRVVTASDDGTARLWDLDGREVAVLRGHQAAVRSAAFSPDGSRVVTASEDRTARLWGRDGKEIAVLRGHEASVILAKFSLDGANIVTASDDRTARLWDRDGRELAVLLKFQSHPMRIIWDADGNEMAVARGHEGVANSAAFSADGMRIVGASEDKTARLWDRGGKEVGVLRGHSGAVLSAAFSPDGSRVVTSSIDGTARLWLVRTEDLLKLADSLVTRDFTDEERRTYRDLLETK